MKNRSDPPLPQLPAITRVSPKAQLKAVQLSEIESRRVVVPTPISTITGIAKIYFIHYMFMSSKCARAYSES